MKIFLEIPQKDLDGYVNQLHKQSGNYGTVSTYDPEEKGVVITLIGERFNIYIYPCHTARLANTPRRIAILPKEGPL